MMTSNQQDVTRLRISQTDFSRQISNIKSSHRSHLTERTAVQMSVTEQVATTIHRVFFSFFVFIY